jgi:hypothetical protein
MYFLKRSSWTFQTAEGYRIGSGPIGNRCDCAETRGASIGTAAAIPAARNPRRFTPERR